MKGRLGAAVVLVVLAAALMGCEPYFVPVDPTQARISISLGSAGGADAQLIVGGRTQSHAELARIGQSVAAALFPGPTNRSVDVGGNTGGYPLVHIHASGVYEPSAHPVVRVDTGRAIAVLRASGVTDVDIEISGPGVPVVVNWSGPPPTDSVNDIYSWDNLGPQDAAPAGTITLNPRPWRGIGDLALAIICLGSLYPAIVAVRRRRRLLSAAAAVVAVVSAAIDVVSAGAVQPNNLGVAGLLNGLELNIVRVVTLTPFIVMPAVICLFVVTMVGRETARASVGIFNPPPGWPLPPPGWTPWPGWQPDPSWPIPPPDWVFWSPPQIPPPTAPPSR